MEELLSNYEKLLEKSKEEGTIVYFDSEEDIKKMEEMNKISSEVREEFNHRQRNS